MSLHPHDLIPNYRDAYNHGKIYLFGDEDTPLEIWTYNEEDDIIPHIHLQSPFMKYDICIRLDIADYYYGHGPIYYRLNDEQKKILNDWFNIENKDFFGHIYNNWMNCLLYSKPKDDLYNDNCHLYRKNLSIPNYTKL